MTWREEIKALKASFRGVDFKTTEAELQVGRRTVQHEFPGRDRPYSEDLGKRATQWHVTGHVQGDDYLTQRDALITALTTAGPGELVHPRYGVLQVTVVGHASIDESHERGGVARFSMHFCEAGSNVFPASREDTVEAVDVAAEACEDALEERFTDALVVAGPASVLNGAIGAVKKTLDGVLSMVRQVTSLAGLSQLVGIIVGVAGSIAALIRAPVVFVQSLRSIFARLVSGVRRPLAALQELRSVFGSHPQPVITAPTGSTRARIQLNAQAHAALVRGLAITTQARMVSLAISTSLQPARTTNTASAVTTPVAAAAAAAAAAAGVTVTDSSAARSAAARATAAQPEEAPITTAAQALALRDLLLDQIDTELETNAPEPEVAAALERLRNAIARDVGVRAELLRERSTFAPQAVLPALVIAHRVYQDATRAEELIARNAVRHPTFVPARPLEVLQ